VRVEDFESKVFNRVALFIDEANVYHSQKTLGWKINYFKMRDYFSTKINLVCINFYTSFVKENFEQQRRFKKLYEAGYTICSKRLKFIKDRSGQTIKKGNLDIELALDAYKLRNSYETIILFSGDSDFAYLLKLLKEEYKTIIIFSTGGHVSKEILASADFYCDLKKFKDYFSN